MREIVHIQAGQCGNQIGAKVGAAPGGVGWAQGPSLTPLRVPGANVVLGADLPAALCGGAGRAPAATFSGSWGEPLSLRL